jgi:hypothetical protein
MLHQTPKYIAYKYLSEIDRGENITVDEFLRKSMGKLSKTFLESKYEETLQSARRDYEKIADRAGVKGRKNFLSGFNISPADVEVLSNALYLQRFPDVFGDYPTHEIEIITKDSHLIDSSKILNRLSPSRKNKINIRDTI